MKYIRRMHKADESEVARLYQEIFTGPYFKQRAHRDFWWVAELDGQIVGFASSNLDRRKRLDACYQLARCGVDPEYWGRSIQAAFIATRVQHAVAVSDATAIGTYTTHSNIHSANNLMDAGFRLLKPKSVSLNFCGGTEWLYWTKQL